MILGMRLTNISMLPGTVLVLLQVLFCCCIIVIAVDVDRVVSTTASIRLSAPQQDKKCLEPMEPGPCRLSLDRFYYNPKSNTCQAFKFGGCRGNGNKFGFLETCKDACVRTNENRAESPHPANGVVAVAATTHTPKRVLMTREQ